ncbi:MAG: V-type ATPase 116kDa subunit family protein [Candidatus Omnitrophica bacterium]|nr:V-type ATPase 116kDa subunit family protein [Candidatus Omnitrophota bacterium]
MFTSSSMEFVSMVVFKDKLEEVASRLVSLGIFQPVDIRKIEDEVANLTSVEIEKENAELQALEISFREILRKLNITVPPSLEVETFSVENVNEIFKPLNDKLTKIALERQEVAGELKTAESMFSQIKDYFVFPLKRGAYYTFLQVNLGKVDEKNMAVMERSLNEIPHLFYPIRVQDKKVVALNIGLRKDRAAIEKILKDVAFQEIELPESDQELSEDVENKLKEKIDGYKKRIEELDYRIGKIAKENKNVLSRIRSFLVLKKSLIEAKRYSYVTDKTVILSGWVLSKDKDSLENEIKKIAGVSYIEKKRAEELGIPKEDIPVYLEHSAIFKPFELLVDSYGLPRYGTIDPTIFVAISFLIMFGAMFGDLGQGLALVLGGFLLRKAKGVKIKQASTLLVYCGISSSIFGALYGTVFGFEQIIPAVWIRPMENIMEVFKISVMFGIAIISVGVVVNIINALRDKDYIKALFDKAGLVTGVIYWLAIAYVSKLLVAEKNMPSIYLILISAGIILIFFKPVIETIFKHRKEKESVFVSFMESLVDILEIIMGYLANTVSFIRIAAFSLAHAGLFLAIFELSRLMHNIGGLPLSALVIILGNILIVLLEGMVVSIQSLRLNYYEFFSKFFISGKQVYKPLTMRGL